MNTSKLFLFTAMLCVFVSIPILRRPVEARVCDIAVVEGRNKGDNAYVNEAYKELAKSGKYIMINRVESLDDLQARLFDALVENGCDCIGKLLTVGHGSPGDISTGDGQKKETAKGHIDGNRQEWDLLMHLIHDYLCPSSEVFLIGCNTGACNKGKDKLSELAEVLGVPVKAPVHKVYGGEIESYMGKGVWQVAVPGFGPVHLTGAKNQKAPVLTRTVTQGAYCPCPTIDSVYSSATECNVACPQGLGCFNLTCQTAYLNNTFKKNDGNPVFEAETSSGGGIPGWEAGGVSQPSVMNDGCVYKMWYMGSDASGTYWRIGYATSTDGVNWTKYSGNPVLRESDGGTWDNGSVYSPSVMKDGNTYKMWYQGYSDMSRIGYATSTDGIHWTKYATPILDLGPNGTWDYHGVGTPTVFKDGNTYKMWYEGYDGWWWRIGYATSTDGIHWTRHSGNPVVREGAAGSWEEGHVGGPSVIKDGNLYHMLYHSSDSDNVGRIGYAVSTDGVQWTKSPDNPILNPGLGDVWDANVAHPTLFKDSNENILKVYYRGENESAGSIGYAIATSLTFFPNETISTPNAPSGPGSGTVGISYLYSTGGSTSSLGHTVEYQFDWKGDGSDLSVWGTPTQSKTWSAAGTYSVKARARCTTDTSAVSGWSTGLSITISAETVFAPNTPSGPNTGVIGKSNTYTSGGSSSNLGHPVEYEFDWKGDGSDLSNWGSASQPKAWTTAGIYNVRARARSTTDTSVISAWSNSLSVNISIPKISVTPSVYDFGTVKVKRSKTASFTIANTGTVDLSISSSAITGSDASMFTITTGSGSKTIKPSKRLTIKVGFKPTSTGTKSAKLRVICNDPLTPTLDVPLIGTGQ